MSDIVTRLRGDIDGIPPSKDELEAAEEIERLRARVSDLEFDAFAKDAGIGQLGDWVDELRAEVERLRARLDWIYKTALYHRADNLNLYVEEIVGPIANGPTIDAAIDAAMKEGK